MTEASLRGGPGLRSVKDMPVLQDGPPPGGFPSVRYGRRIPNTGPTGTAIFGVSALVISYGFYKVRPSHVRLATHTPRTRVARTPQRLASARVAQRRVAAPPPAGR